jgi:hypothetical protein
MGSEPSWLMLALALGLVLALTAVCVWLSVTEVRAVKPAPAMVRPRRARRGLRPGAPGRGTDEPEGTE